MEEGEFKIFRAHRFTILAKFNGEFYKLFQIIFNKNKKNQFSIIVSFPYFLEKKGILSKLLFPANTKTVDNLSLEESGSLSGHLIKYSHWEDGNSHFSQDGKVYTDIKNLSVPLDKNVDHIFTVQLQGLHGFQKKSSNIKKFKPKNIEIEYQINDSNLDALKFTGWWFDTQGMIQDKKIGGPRMSIRMPDGKYKSGFALAPIDPKYPECFLFLSGEMIPLLNTDDETLLTFIGGFDKTKKFEEDTTFLSFIYPVENFEDLKNKIPSIDLKE